MLNPDSDRSSNSCSTLQIRSEIFMDPQLNPFVFSPRVLIYYTGCFMSNGERSNTTEHKQLWMFPPLVWFYL